MILMISSIHRVTTDMGYRLCNNNKNNTCTMPPVPVTLSIIIASFSLSNTCGFTSGFMLHRQLHKQLRTGETGYAR